MKRVYICSPYAGDVEGNTERAQWLCREAIKDGCAPYAPHLLYPQIIDDRQAGITCGLAYLGLCDELWVYANNGISPGMRQEIDHAQHLDCLLYTSDAADEEDSVDLGGRRIIKKKKPNKKAH